MAGEGTAEGEVLVLYAIIVVGVFLPTINLPTSRLPHNALLYIAPLLITNNLLPLLLLFPIRRYTPYLIPTLHIIYFLQYRNGIFLVCYRVAGFGGEEFVGAVGHLVVGRWLVLGGDGVVVLEGVLGEVVVLCGEILRSTNYFHPLIRVPPRMNATPPRVEIIILHQFTLMTLPIQILRHHRTPRLQLLLLLRRDGLVRPLSRITHVLLELGGFFLHQTLLLKIIRTNIRLLLKLFLCPWLRVLHRTA